MNEALIGERAMVRLQPIMLNPQWLRTFAALAELGNFTRAAKRLDLTQAAVSQHVRHLEDALCLLVIRRSRAIELTPAGRALLDYCEAMNRRAGGLMRACPVLQKRPERLE
ncbi:LysR family transcriptional regulator [Caballeronia sp. LZ065]|uniref:LysR family transcriptional regulator n=1 Tax=Caballeronia sp. LZ065 TaxID=3038571 RepID=UPI00286C0594|nr:LysR family transcriptional regulator [Caballeronia sp. LZ065]